MGRFWEIEGLRGWLAWAVVISHLFVVLSVYDYGAAYLAPLVGDYAVKIFILISGFVIANLVIEQREAWGPFITRRIFRIFPAYLAALAIGAVSTPLAIEGLSRVAWGSDPASYMFSSLQGGQESVAAHPWTHWLLHLTLLQGVVPDNILPWSSVTFVGPAWSLSLEWQFYLVAPALVWAMRSRDWVVWLTLVAFAAALLFQQGAFGSYGNTSSLLGGLWLFVIGIATRLVFPWLRSTPLPTAAIAVAAFGVGLIGNAILPVALWLAFVVVIARTPSRNILDRLVARTSDLLFASAPAKLLGARSYSVYVMHMPILKLLLFVLPLQAMTQMQALAALALTALPLTLIVSELSYRAIELPMMRLGARLASAGAAPAAGAAANRAPSNP